MTALATMSKNELREQMGRYHWYHTIDLRQGVSTPGEYDHNPNLPSYGLPESLHGKEVIDVGPAHGFFAFEMEKRGASRVVTVELPHWSAHDGSQMLRDEWKHESSDQTAEDYLHGAMAFAIEARGSRVEQRFDSIYNLTPQSYGTFDLVFCGSLLLHLTDPLRALYALRSVCHDQCIIATTICNDASDTPQAYFHADAKAQTFWMPNMACLERWALAAGFNRVERISTFKLNGVHPSPHGTIHAFVD